MDMLERVGPLRPGLLLSLLCQIMDGLAYLHGERVLHRDIKPHNILLAHVCPATHPFCASAFSVPSLWLAFLCLCTYHSLPGWHGQACRLRML